jgi:kinesin family protein 15
VIADTKSSASSEDHMSVNKPNDVYNHLDPSNKDENMGKELRNLMEQLESSENQRLALEKYYKKLLVDRDEDLAKERVKYQNLMTEVSERDQICMSVKRELEMALASLQEAEFKRKKMRQEIQKHEGSIKDQKHIQSLEKELIGAHASLAHMQKQLALMETGMGKFPQLLEERLKEAEAAWQGERKDMCMQLNNVKIEAAKRMCEANEALKRFEDSQEMIREAETLVTTLTRVNESARREKFDLITRWGKERESSIAQIEELKTVIKKSLKIKQQALQLHEQTETQMSSVLETFDKTTSALLEKLESISSRLLDFPGPEDSFLSNLDLTLCKLEEDARSYLSLSMIICAEFDNILAEKDHLEKELERKEELLKGSMFDLSMLQESIAEYTDMKDEIDKGVLVIKSLQEDIQSRDEKLKTMEAKQAFLEHEKEANSKSLLLLEKRLSEIQHCTVSLEQENADLKQSLDEARKKIWALNIQLDERRLTIEELESEMSDISFITEQKMIVTLNKELKAAISDNDQLQTKLAILNEKFEAMKETSDENQRLVVESREVSPC